MKNLIYLLIIFTLFSCGGESVIQVAGKKFIIPDNYLISSYSNKKLDNKVKVIAITLNNDSDFNEFFGENSWLPNSSLGVSIYSNEGSKIQSFSSKNNEPEKISLNEYDIKEFDKSYRVFDKEIKSKWRLFLKERSDFSNKGDASASWYAQCLAFGGMKGVNLSRESLDIPTSCKINIRHHNLVLRISTTEKNLINKYPQLIKSVLNKVDSWIVNE